MKGWRRHLHAAVDATEPGPEAVERVRRRARWHGRLLREAAAEPRPGAVARLRLRHLARRPRRWVLTLPLMAAAAVLLWALWPARSLSGRLDAPQLVSRALTTDVQLDYQGSGSVEGTARAPHIHWEAGTLAIDVTPNHGIDLVVETDEGSVQVVGTAFAVTRDALGTHVSVERGHVRVSCVAGTERALGAGDEATCLPVRAAAWLGRAQALLVVGQPTDDVLDAITHGLTLAAPADPASGELVALRIRVLVDAGRYPEALAAADAYLASGAATRRGEVEALAAELRGGP